MSESKHFFTVSLVRARISFTIHRKQNDKFFYLSFTLVNARCARARKTKFENKNKRTRRKSIENRREIQTKYSQSLDWQWNLDELNQNPNVKSNRSKTNDGEFGADGLKSSKEIHSHFVRSKLYSNSFPFISWSKCKMMLLSCALCSFTTLCVGNLCARNR